MVRLSILCALLFAVAACFSVVDAAFSHTTAKVLRDYAAASYCSSSLISKWKCQYCQGTQLTRAKFDSYFYSGISTNTAGFAAVDDAEKTIIFSFRGTIPTSIANLAIDFEAGYAAFPPAKNSLVQVHAGFLKGWNGLQTAVGAAALRLRKAYPTYKIYVTGHSLGGSLAAFAALYLQGLFGSSVTVNVYTYGQPRTGNAAFASYVNRVLPRFYRIVHDRDVVPHVPLLSMNYRHSANEYWYDNDFKTFKYCATGDDSRCSNGALDWRGLFAYNVGDHLSYFNAPIGPCSLQAFYTSVNSGSKAIVGVFKFRGMSLADSTTEVTDSMEVEVDAETELEATAELEAEMMSTPSKKKKTAKKSTIKSIKQGSSKTVKTSKSDVKKIEVTSVEHIPKEHNKELLAIATAAKHIVAGKANKEKEIIKQLQKKVNQSHKVVSVKASSAH